MLIPKLSFSYWSKPLEPTGLDSFVSKILLENSWEEAKPVAIITTNTILRNFIDQANSQKLLNQS